jgi:hypothetical protein
MGCQVVRYCSREHQVQHRPEHKSVCNNIKKCRSKVDRADCAIRNTIPDFMTLANAFETHVDHFWCRHYMSARFELADTMRKLSTLDGVTEALDQMRDMLRLCRCDNMGVQELIPPMMLQLDQDAECYDFIKWYATEGQRSDYDLDDRDLPFLNIKGANVLEDVSYMDPEDPECGDLQHVSAVVLLKLKLLVDIINLKLVRKVIAPRLPPELWEQVEVHVVRSPISAQWVGKPYDNITSAQRELEDHVLTLSGIARPSNQHFTSALVESDGHSTYRPGYHSPGSPDEAKLLLHYSYTAWWQHEGVLELLQSAKSIAGKDSKYMFAVMMRNKAFEYPGSRRSKEELLSEVSRNRLWKYLEDAVADAMSLNENRPSDVRRVQERQRNREEFGEEFGDADDDEDEEDEEDYYYDDDSE